MNKITKHLAYLAALTLFVNAIIPVLPVEILPRIETAHAAQGGPSEFKVGVGDLNCGAQHQDYGSAIFTNPVGEDYGYVTDSNGKDPDCARIYMNPGNTSISGGAMYTTDFRIGIAMSESENGCSDRKSAVSYTPWASDGGGDAFSHAASSVNAADCIWIHYQTRPIPNGAVRIINTQAGISVGGGSLMYTPWASQGAGWSSYSTTSDDFTSARIVLNVQLNYKYNADYVSSTIPQNPPDRLTKNQVLTNKNIVMKNIPDVGASTATPWLSDQEIDSFTNQTVQHCYEWTPTSASETCTQTTIYTSSKFKLRRIDNNTAAVTTTSGDLAYKRTVVSQYGAALVWIEGSCYPIFGFNPESDTSLAQIDNSPKLSNLFGLIKHAGAVPVPPSDDGEMCDPPIPSDPPQYVAVYQSQNQSANILNNQSATFELDVTGVLDGAYQLQFQMVNTETDELFGDPDAVGNANTIARIDVLIGTWGLSCTATATTTVGVPASFAINATGSPTSSVTVTMSSTPPPGPPNPTMSNSPLVLSVGNSYAGVATVETTGLTPGTYPLVFTGVDRDSASFACPASLQVNGLTSVTSVPTDLAIYQTPSLDFTVNGGPSATIPANSTATLSWSTMATNDGNLGVATGDWSSNKEDCTPDTSPHNVTVGPLAAGTYTYSLTCPGFGSSWTPLATVTIIASSPPTPPINAAAANATCSTIDITWSNGSGGTPQFYRVYHNTTGNDSDFVQIGPDILYSTTADYSYTHTNPDPGRNYYAIAAWSGMARSAYTYVDAYPISPIQCVANISLSDKDILSVGSYNNPSEIICSGEHEVIPTNDIFRSGNQAIYRISICNSGTQAITGVTVTDTLENLTNPTNFQYSPAGCESSPADVNGSIVTFHLDDIAPQIGNNPTVCSITLEATISAPDGSPSALYRFRNTAILSTDQGSRNLLTPYYLFSLGAGVPDRNETPPQ